MNLTHRLLSKNRVVGELKAGEEIHLEPDQVLIEDATGSMTYMQFELLGVERVRAPLAVMYVDHNVLQLDELNADEHRFLRNGVVNSSSCRRLTARHTTRSRSSTCVHWSHLSRSLTHRVTSCRSPSSKAPLSVRFVWDRLSTRRTRTSRALRAYSGGRVSIPTLI